MVFSAEKWKLIWPGFEPCISYSSALQTSPPALWFSEVFNIKHQKAGSLGGDNIIFNFFVWKSNVLYIFCLQKEMIYIIFVQKVIIHNKFKLKVMIHIFLYEKVMIHNFVGQKINYFKLFCAKKLLKTWQDLNRPPPAPNTTAISTTQQLSFSTMNHWTFWHTTL